MRTPHRTLIASLSAAAAVVGALLAPIPANALLAHHGDPADFSSTAAKDADEPLTGYGHSPIGRLDKVVPDSGPYGALRLSGWAVDPDYPHKPVTIVYRLDGNRYAGRFVAPVKRTDIAAAHPGVPSTVGFVDVASVPSPKGRGTHRICATAIDVGDGSNTSLGCRTFTETHANLISGHVDSITHHGPIYTIRGWALDPFDGKSPTPFYLGVPGRGGSYLWNLHGIADVSRPDVDAVKPGSRHGFVIRFDITKKHDPRFAPHPGQRICFNQKVTGTSGYRTFSCTVWPRA